MTGPSPDVPPQNLEAEESIIGAMMISASAINTAIDVLGPNGAGMFYRESHSRIYRAALALAAKGEPVDAITLTDELETRGELDAVGGRVRLHEIAALVPATANVAHYARIVRECSVLRSLIRAGGQIARMGWERPGEIDALIADADGLLMGIRGEMEQRREETMTMWEAAEYLDDKFKHPPEEEAGIPTPWSFLTSMHGGRLYVLGGYSADGKTSQGGHFFLKAVSESVPSTFLSMEMPKEDLAERLAAVKGLPAKRVQSGKLMPEQTAHAAKVVGDFARYGRDGLIWDAPAADVAMIRRHVMMRKPKLLVVDHLQQFHVSAQYERQDIEAIIRGLWQIAREFDVAILLLAQLSRSGDKKQPFPLPTMASLKGSGAIEQLAWAVWFIYRERDENNIAKSESKFVIAKNRSGPTGLRPLTFWDRETRFEEAVREG